MVSGDVYAVTESGLELRVDPAATPKAPSTPQEFLEDFRCVNTSGLAQCGSENKWI